MKNLVLFGNGNYAESVYHLLRWDSPFEVLGFTVDAAYLAGEQLCGKPVVAFDRVETVFPPSECAMLVALSFQQLNRLREQKYGQAKEKGYELATYLSSRASTWPDLVIGENCIVSEQSTIGPCARIGNDVIIGPNVVIGHNSVIGDHCFIGAGAVILGNVAIGSGCLIGANATLKERIVVGADCLVGAGATITQDAAPKSVYFAPPAELLDRTSDELREWLTWSSPSRAGGQRPALKEAQSIGAGQDADAARRRCPSS